MGKGSTPRPFTDRKTFEDNFDRIFGKKKEADGDKPKHTDKKKTD